MYLRLTALPPVAIAWSTPLLAELSHAEVNQVLVDGVITPAYVQYHHAMQDLAPAITRLCETADATELDEAQTAFKASADAWQRLQPLAFGPIKDTKASPRESTSGRISTAPPASN